MATCFVKLMITTSTAGFDEAETERLKKNIKTKEVVLASKFKKN